MKRRNNINKMLENIISMTLLNIPDEFISSIEDDKITYNFDLSIFIRDNEVKFGLDDISTSWMSEKTFG